MTHVHVRTTDRATGLTVLYRARASRQPCGQLSVYHVGVGLLVPSVDMAGDTRVTVGSAEHPVLDDYALFLDAIRQNPCLNANLHVVVDDFKTSHCRRNIRRVSPSVLAADVPRSGTKFLYGRCSLLSNSALPLPANLSTVREPSSVVPFLVSAWVIGCETRSSVREM
jgi:hypothetical protein